MIKQKWTLYVSFNSASWILYLSNFQIINLNNCLKYLSIYYLRGRYFYALSYGYHQIGKWLYIQPVQHCAIIVLCCVSKAINIPKMSQTRVSNIDVDYY